MAESRSNEISSFAQPGEPFIFKPLIDDILRTRYCIPGSIFLVEGIESIPVTKAASRSPSPHITPSVAPARWRAVRLLLGDGDYCIQGLLRPEMHRFLDTGDIAVGCYVRLDSFTLQTQDVNEQEPGRDLDAEQDEEQMIFLVVDSIVTVGWDTAVALLGTQEEEYDFHDSEMDHGSILDSESELDMVNMGYEDVIVPKKTHWMSEQDTEDDSGEAFEDMDFSPRKMSQRRTQAAAVTALTNTRHYDNSLALPNDWTDPTTPLKLTPLRSIPNLPYKQNWIVNVLAVVTSISDVEPAHLPPYKQRRARLTDPSTSKHILLTVFLDPEDFSPQLGSVVLLSGVKNHGYDGGSLKKYSSDRPKNGRRWWFEDPWELGWCDVLGLKKWWLQREATMNATR
jgi:hypothetical protein